MLDTESLQDSLKTHLAADPAVIAALSGGGTICVGQQNEKALPRLVIGSVEVPPAISTDCGKLYEPTVTFHAFVREAGNDGAHRILKAVAEALDEAEIVIVGARYAGDEEPSLRVFRDPSPNVSHGVLSKTFLFDI